MAGSLVDAMRALHAARTEDSVGDQRKAVRQAEKSVAAAANAIAVMNKLFERGKVDDKSELGTFDEEGLLTDLQKLSVADDDDDRDERADAVAANVKNYIVEKRSKKRRSRVGKSPRKQQAASSRRARRLPSETPTSSDLDSSFLEGEDDSESEGIEIIPSPKNRVLGEKNAGLYNPPCLKSKETAQAFLNEFESEYRSTKVIPGATIAAAKLNTLQHLLFAEYPELKTTR